MGCGPPTPVPAADFFLEHLSRTLYDPVDPTQIGSLDRALHARVNGEIYRFSGTKTMERFRRDPVRWCGILRDPVSGLRFLPDRTSPRLDTQESPYFFIGEATRAAFKKEPAKYEIRRPD